MEINGESVTFSHPQNCSSKEKGFAAVMKEIAIEYLISNDIATKEGLEAFTAHLKGALSVHTKMIKSCSLIMVVQCATLEMLERLWGDYQSDHLNKVAENCLVTERIKRKFDIESLTLKTTIVEEDYMACRHTFTQHLRELTRLLFSLDTFCLVTVHVKKNLQEDCSDTARSQ